MDTMTAYVIPTSTHTYEYLVYVMAYNLCSSSGNLTLCALGYFDPLIYWWGLGGPLLISETGGPMNLKFCLQIRCHMLNLIA